MNYKTPLLIIFILISQSLFSQSREKYKLNIELWHETKGGLNSIEFEKIIGELLMTRYDSIIHTEYIIDNNCRISIKTDNPQSTITDSRLGIYNKGIIVESDCDSRQNDLIVMFNQVFSLNFIELEENRNLKDKNSSGTISKLFKLGEYDPSKFSKGFEILGSIILNQQNIENVTAKFLSHFPTSVSETYSGGIIELKKKNK